jgi:four helix bundle protein
MSSKDPAHYTTMAFGSFMESVNHLLLAEELGYIQTEDIVPFKQQASELARILSGLRDSPWGE